MGLTIHYKLKYKGTEDSIKEKLNLLKTIVKTVLPKVEQEPIWDLDYSIDINNENENIKQSKDESSGYRWAKIQLEPRGENYSVIKNLNMHKGCLINFWAGPGCEPTNIGLISKDGLNWSGGGFTKTQYAEKFVEAHLSIITLLDICKAIGILKEVHDEGYYWETRDLKKLADNINESTAFISSMGKKLKENFGADSIVSAIDKAKNYVSVKNGKRF